MDAMKQWYAEKPDLFVKQPRNHPGPDTYATVVVGTLTNKLSRRDERSGRLERLVYARHGRELMG
jgi:hypothetical protein